MARRALLNLAMPVAYWCYSDNDSRVFTEAFKEMRASADDGCSPEQMRGT